MATKNNSRALRGLSLFAAVAVVGVVAVIASDEAGTSRTDAARTDAGHADGSSDVQSPAAALASPPAAPPVQLRLLHAERFQVQQPFHHVWRSDQPLVTSGWLMVLDGKADLLAPTQDLEPVLYVGAQTAERVNAGSSGRLVVIVPGDFDLQTAPIFLGDKALPEALDQTRIDTAVNLAIAKGAVAPTAATVQVALAPEGKPYPTDFELRLRAIDLVELHSPTETELIAGWRLPRVK